MLAKNATKTTALSITALAKIAGCSRGPIIRAINSGVLPARKLNAKMFIAPSDAYAWLEQCQRNAVVTKT